MLGSYAYIQLGKGLAKGHTTTLFTTFFGTHPLAAFSIFGEKKRDSDRGILGEDILVECKLNAKVVFMLR